VLDFPDGEVQVPDKNRRRDAVALLESFIFLAAPDWEFHGHRAHPPLNGLMLDLGDISVRLQADDFSVNRIAPLRRLAGAGRCEQCYSQQDQLQHKFQLTTCYRQG